MLPGEHLPADRTEEENHTTKGIASGKPTREIPPACDPVSRGNSFPADHINAQPQPAAAPATGTSKGTEGSEKSTCPRCGLTVPDHRQTGPPLLPGRTSRQGSKQSVDSSCKRSGGCVAGPHQPTVTAADSCLHLLLACLSCQVSVLLLGLLEACSSCLNNLCSSCCHACARCCSAIQEVPVEELNCHAHCHSVLFESCCEPTECLEFCLECCEICHRS